MVRNSVVLSNDVKYSSSTLEGTKAGRAREKPKLGTDWGKR